MKLFAGVLGIAIGMAAQVPLTFAQTESTVPKPAASESSTQTLYLNNASSQFEATEILTAIRNMLQPSAKVYLVPSQNAIVMSTSRDQLALAQKIINDLDRPRKTYRLTYTIAELDGQKRIGVQHFAMVVVSGQKTTLRQGSKVPVATGSYNTGTSGSGPMGVQTQVTYLDVGLNFDATLDESVNGVRLRTKAEQSSIAEGVSGLGPQDPIVRQTVLEGTAILTPGKPLMLGSLDVPGSTRHLDVDVMMEVVR